MGLNFSPLENAINQLEKSLGCATSVAAQADSGLFEQLRNSVIQHFEFTYELSHKMLKRYLEETAANPEELTWVHLIRTGNEKGLLRSDWSHWKDYRQVRTYSSHTHNQEKAEAVYAIALGFLEEARHLYQQLIAKNNRA